MNNYHFPGTNVQADILQPNPSTGFVSLFYHATETTGSNMLSVNAGTSNAGCLFEVGLSGINGAFANSLGNAGQQTNAYQTIHQQLYNASGSALTAFNNSFTPADPVQFCLLQKPDPSYNLSGYDGIVFIDIFNAAQLPNDNPLNYGMVYLVPPYSGNYSSNAAFLQAIQASCLTIAFAIQTFNTVYAASGNTYNLQQANALRMCLFSSGIYGGGIAKTEVAQYNLQGLQTAVSSKNNTITLVEFEFPEAAQWLNSNTNSI